MTAQPTAKKLYQRDLVSHFLREVFHVLLDKVIGSLFVLLSFPYVLGHLMEKSK